MSSLKLVGRIACVLLLMPMAWAETIDPSNTDIRYTGRWNMDNPSEPWVAWQGSSILVKFSGTEITGEFDAGSTTEQYRVIIDGVPNTGRLSMTSSRATYTLADGLAPGEHTVEIMKETFNGHNTTFYGFEITGTLMTPPARPSLHIEFFGDSNANGSSNYSEKNSGAMGTYYAFPAMISRMLDAEMNDQSVGGATLYGGGDNTVGSFIFSEDYYNQDTGYRSGFDPHIIVVNAGANDLGAGKTVIKNRYKSVVADLRTVYGTTPHIVLMNSYGWDVNEPANFSHEVVTELADPNLSVCLFPWMWEQWHGSQWDHSGETHVLADHLEAINPAWAAVNPNDIVDGFGRNWDFANGSFEHQAPFGAYGWRYFTDGVERVNDSANAADGNYFIRLDQGEHVHQPTDATGDLLPGATTGDQTYYITAMIRGTAAGAQAQIITHFEGQQLYTHDDNPATFQTSTFDVTTTWEQYTHTATASSGIWTIFNYLSALTGTVEFDNVRMSDQPPDTDPPIVGVDTLVTDDPTPPLTGTVDDSDATVSITVDGQTNAASNLGDGTWLLSNNTLTELSDGTYDVEVTATDLASNVGSDNSLDELTIDTSAVTGGAITSSIPSHVIYESQVLVLSAPGGGTNYQWYKDGSAMSNDAPRITGAQSQHLTFNPTQTSDVGTYTCRYDYGSKIVLETDPFVLVVLPPAPLSLTSQAGVGAAIGLVFLGCLAVIRSLHVEQKSF